MIPSTLYAARRVAMNGIVMRWMVVGGMGMIALQALAAGKVCDVRAYGAEGDGVAKDTVAIQKAIDDCSGKGGGTVVLKAGQFVTGPIGVKSNVTGGGGKDA